MRYLTIIILVICCARQSNKQEKLEHNELETPLITEKLLVTKTNKAEHFFSSSQKKDTFSLQLKGAYLTKSEIRFRIISSKNEIIYEDQFPVMALYGFGPDVANTSPDSISIERHLLKRFDEFFNDENFMSPAIGDHVEYDEQYNGVISKEDWLSIKRNTESIGFAFTLWEESIVYIAYSKKLNKCVIYYGCC